MCVNFSCKKKQQNHKYINICCSDPNELNFLCRKLKYDTFNYLKGVQYTSVYLTILRIIKLKFVRIINGYQWCIQDFPNWGSANPKGGGAKLLFRQNFPKNCMKIKEIGPRERTHLQRLPFGSANDSCGSNTILTVNLVECRLKFSFEHLFG